MKTGIGFIGGGNMARAMLGGIEADAKRIYVSDASSEVLEAVREKYGVKTSSDNKTVAWHSGVIFLSVKPKNYEKVIQEISDDIDEGSVVVSLTPGKSLEWLGKCFGKRVKLVRTMPNTPAMVGEGMTGVCRNEFVTDDEFETVCALLRGFGRVEQVEEGLMDAVVAVSGSSPAYVFMLIEAMADGAVQAGMARDKAYTFAAQAVYGSAKMVMQTGMHPGALKDMVCSPGGTTIEAVRVLEERGFRSSIIEAMSACAEKSKGI